MGERLLSRDLGTAPHRAEEQRLGDVAVPAGGLRRWLSVNDHGPSAFVLPTRADRDFARIARVADHRHALSIADIETQDVGARNRLRESLGDLGALWLKIFGKVSNHDVHSARESGLGVLPEVAPGGGARRRR